jgi:hypothetical protein
MVATGGTVITRPTSPRFNWRNPSKISIPTFRFATVLVIDFIPNLFQHASRDVLCDILRVQSQHPNLPVPSAQKINDVEPTTLAATRNTPTHLAHASGAGNDLFQDRQ